MSAFVVFLISREEGAPLGTVFAFFVHPHALRRQHLHTVVLRGLWHPLVGCCPGRQSDGVEGQEGIPGCYGLPPYLHTKSEGSV